MEVYQTEQVFAGQFFFLLRMHILLPVGIHCLHQLPVNNRVMYYNLVQFFVAWTTSGHTMSLDTVVAKCNIMIGTFSPLVSAGIAEFSYLLDWSHNDGICSLKGRTNL